MSTSSNDTKKRRNAFEILLSNGKKHFKKAAGEEPPPSANVLEQLLLAAKQPSAFKPITKKEILEYLEIDEKTFSKTVDSFRSPHLWEKKNNNWILKHQL